MQVDLHEYACGISARNPKDLKIVHINTQSLKCFQHFAEFEYIFSNSGIDAIAVSETWLNDSVNNESVSIPGYDIYRNDRFLKNGGGNAVYVRSDIRCKVVVRSANTCNLRPEYLFLELCLRDCKVLLISAYRLPKVSYMDMFLEDLQSHIFYYSYTIVAL